VFLAPTLLGAGGVEFLGFLEAVALSVDVDDLRFLDMELEP
jgi:hypothetical protein